MNSTIAIAIALLFSSSLAQAKDSQFQCVEKDLPQPSAAASSKHKLKSVAGSMLNIFGVKGVSESVWTDYLGAQDYPEKVKAIYDAANEYDLSPIVLTGAILQESSAANLGIGRDFDNWTCGPSQFSVLAWCSWAQTLDASTQAAIHWPTDLVKAFQAQNPGVDICQEDKFIAREHLRPFLEIGLKRMEAAIHSKNEYLMQPEYLLKPSPIQFSDVANSYSAISQTHGSLLAGNSEVENFRFLMTKSFAENCSNHEYAFRAMAHTLRQTYAILPPEVQNAQMLPKTADDNADDWSNPLYSDCGYKVKTHASPLNIGWLIADSIYNAGPSLLTGILAYQSEHNIPWEKFSPEDLLKAIHYAISPKFGMSGIGPEEAKNHIRGVLDSVGWSPGKTKDEQ